MGRKSKKINLSSTERASLESGFKKDKSAQFQKRCHIILVKSKGWSSKEVGEIFGVTDQVVNNWVKRFESAGIAGLRTKPGQGRRPILDQKSDAEKVKREVKKERQRLKVAKSILEKELNKEFSLLTLKRFLKNLSADGNASV